MKKPKWGVAVLVGTKVDFRTSNITGYKEGHFMVIKG